MADLQKYPTPLYDPLHPYHWEYDNLPLKALIRRDEAINDEVNWNSSILRDANGTQGTLSNRLNQSIDEDGNLKTTAVNESLHSIAEHTDDSKSITSDELEDFATLGYTLSNPVKFVRMTDAERSKLALIADEATKMSLTVETPSNIVMYEEGPVVFESSSTITWEAGAGNSVKANMAFPPEAAHRHYYNVIPITEDYLNFKTTSLSTAYVDGSLRVYINGVRLSDVSEVYVPGRVIDSAWTLNMFTADAENGTFVLETEVSEDDVVMIDFDVILT